MRHASFKITFRATLFSLMLGVLITAVLLLGIAGYIYARFAVGDLGQKVLTQTANRIDQHVQHALDTAEDEASTIRSLIEKNWLDPEDHENATEYFLSSLKARPSLSYLSFGTPGGKYYHGFRDRDGNLSSLWLVPGRDGERRLVEFAIQEDGHSETIRDIAQSVRTPPYERPYFITAREAGDAVWTESYVFLGSGESLDVPGVSRAVPVYSGNGSDLLGVVTADFDLHALSRFLRNVDLGPGGLCFLVEISPEGVPQIIAHPDAAAPNPGQRLDLTRPAPNGEGRITVAADQVADPRVVHSLASLGPNLATPNRLSDKFVVDVSGQSYVGEVHRLERKGGPAWIICMLIPESELLGDVHRMAKIMAFLGLSGVIVAAALSLLVSRRISMSLRSIAGETKEIGQFRLMPKQPVSSRIEEIGTLANAVEEMKTSLRSFQKYVPSELVRQLLATSQEAELGGSRKELTVYFSDIVGFTSISEQLPATQLVEILSDYLDEMTTTVLDHGGTVDKYIGDAIMAFWGAPQPCEQHAVEACRTALANQARLNQLRDGWEKKGLPALRARIGLHTGTAIVGNFGSPSRLDYTAIGDTVNVASRLEGLNRIYGTEILISELTLQQVRDHFLTRPLDKVAVKGRKQGMMVYELVAERQREISTGLAWVTSYEEGLGHYFEMNWKEAIHSFETVQRTKPDDVATGIMIERCSQYLESPPGDGWDGIFRAPK